MNEAKEEKQVSVSAKQLKTVLQLLKSKLPKEPEETPLSDFRSGVGIISALGTPTMLGIAFFAHFSGPVAPVLFLLGGVTLGITSRFAIITAYGKWREQIRGIKIKHLSLTLKNFQELELVLTGKNLAPSSYNYLYELQRQFSNVGVLRVLDSLSDTLRKHEEYNTGIVSALRQNGIFATKSSDHKEVAKLVLEYLDEDMIPVDKLPPPPEPEREPEPEWHP